MSLLDRLKNLVKSHPPETSASSAQMDILHFDGAVLTFRTPQRMPLALKISVGVNLPDGPQTVQLKLQTRETHNDELLTYTAEVEGPVEVLEALYRQHGVGGASERRAHPRVGHQLQVMGRELPNFRAVTADLSAAGFRLVTEGPMEPGTPLELVVQFDHDQFQDLRVPGQVVWCRPRDTRTWWIGIHLDDEDAQDALSEFTEELFRTRVRHQMGQIRQSARGGEGPADHS